MERVCKVCGSKNNVKINTYKHYWNRCNDCESIERETKSDYFFEKLIPLSLAPKLPGYFCALLSGKYYDKEKLFVSYNHYGETSAIKDAKGTIWEGETSIIRSRLTKFGIDINGKNILDISGGPGFVANDLNKSANYVLLTEYSSIAVEGMKKNHTVDIKKYDYNTDQIGDITSEKFDLIMIRFSINFCLNVDQFLKDLYKILKPSGVIYIEHVEPNKGCMLRWQFDDYTYNIVFGIKILNNIAKNASLSLLHQEILMTEEYNKPYWVSYPTWKVKLFYFFIRRIRDYYKLIFPNNLPNDLRQNSWVSIYKKA